MAAEEDKRATGETNAGPVTPAREDAGESVRQEREALTDAMGADADERPVLIDGKQPGEDSAQ